MKRIKPTITIFDNLENIIFTQDYFTLQRAKDALTENNFSKQKNMPLTEDDKISQIGIKKRILFKSDIVRKYKAILEY